MIKKLKDTKKSKKLFGYWQETLIWSCLQGVMGEVYVENIENPQSAMAHLGDFMFVAGKPDKDFLTQIKINIIRDFIIMVPQNYEWAELIEQAYGVSAKKVTRYATKKEGNIFDKSKLELVVSSLPKEYKLQMINEHIFNVCRDNIWSKDFVFQYSDYKMYELLGLGVVITENSEVIAGASSYSSYKEGIEIEIITREDYRRKGLAYVCGAKLILECLKRNIYPSCGRLH